MRYNQALHRFTLFVAICILVLIAAGGLVTSTGSALAVPDWPLSYGQVMPPMVGGILYEHGHRMIATFVGVLTTVLAVWYWQKESRNWVRNLALGALAAVIAQGVLGGLTVLFLLPTPVSVSHATLAQTFFVIVSSHDDSGRCGLRPIDSRRAHATYAIGFGYPRFSPRLRATHSFFLVRCDGTVQSIPTRS